MANCRLKARRIRLPCDLVLLAFGIYNCVLPLNDVTTSTFYTPSLGLTGTAMSTQIHFTGEANCDKFVPNRFKENICTSCNQLISKHERRAIENDDVILRVSRFALSLYILNLHVALCYRPWSTCCLVL